MTEEQCVNDELSYLAMNGFPACVEAITKRCVN